VALAIRWLGRQGTSTQISKRLLNVSDPLAWRSRKQWHASSSLGQMGTKEGCDKVERRHGSMPGVAYVCAGRSTVIAGSAALELLLGRNGEPMDRAHSTGHHGRLFSPRWVLQTQPGQLQPMMYRTPLCGQVTSQSPASH
jgi:hypothetical protein